MTLRRRSDTLMVGQKGSLKFLDTARPTAISHPLTQFTERTGWAPRYLAAFEKKRLTGAMPLYVKSHSRGEYVFDWAWADAYQRHGIEYYPKLLCAIPFTPVMGPRILESEMVKSLLRYCHAATKTLSRYPGAGMERLGAKLDGGLRSHQIATNGALRGTCV